jgi:hypothetical protein
MQQILIKVTCSLWSSVKLTFRKLSIFLHEAMLEIYTN